MVKFHATGGSLLMDCLIGLGARKGFGVPGESYLAVLDAMYDRADQFQLILCRHEGGAAYMADRYAGNLFCYPRSGRHKRIYWHSHGHAKFVANAGVYWTGWHRY